MNIKMQKYYSITTYNTFGAGLQDNFLGNSIFILCINKKDPQISPELSDSIDKSIEQPLSSKESIHLAAQI